MLYFTREAAPQCGSGSFGALGARRAHQRSRSTQSVVGANRRLPQAATC